MNNDNKNCKRLDGLHGKLLIGTEYQINSGRYYGVYVLSEQGIKDAVIFQRTRNNYAIGETLVRAGEAVKVFEGKDDTLSLSPYADYAIWCKTGPWEADFKALANKLEKQEELDNKIKTLKVEHILASY